MDHDAVVDDGELGSLDSILGELAQFRSSTRVIYGDFFISLFFSLFFIPRPAPIVSLLVSALKRSWFADFID